MDRFNGKKTLITGGLGFVGSNLAARLAGLGAEVTIVDAMLPGYGGNLFNINGIENEVIVNFSDIRDKHSMNHLVKGKDYIFHLAGQVDHILSLTDPYPDIDINIRGSAVLMEAIRENAPEARVVYTGTRGQYGPAVHLPVNEEAQMNPKGLYELTNLTAEKMMLIYNDNHNIASTVLRLTNIYGPRAQMRHSRYGVVNWFVRVALDGGTIKVFGKGDLKRDFLFIDDAVDAILLSSLDEKAVGEVFNVGRDIPSDFLELAKMIISIAGTGKWEFAPFSPERAAQEPGHFYSDITKIRNTLGWQPETDLETGLRSTIDFYRAHRGHYWE
ncbi:MAG: NAD-dependent epimerase/dehydratase family protein [Candidatus Krumholzibacteriota bacterium]|nr:NAD-dependent epimerase/dehydratase family protein [Candidatus Krumholzibacteriota bacterium]